MITVNSHNGQSVFVLKPNCSMSWQQNKVVLLVVSVWSASIGVGFALLGAWPVMPFVGLELMALGAGLYYVSWKTSHQEVLRITRDQVMLEQGVRWPKKSWQWSREDVQTQVLMANHPDQVPNIQLLSRLGKSVRIGGFLNQSDCEDLIRQLTRAGILLRRSYHNQSTAF